jgi:hypothetical protein
MNSDWPVHKLLCKSFKDFDVKNAPPDYYRAIFFSEDGKKPQFIWLQSIVDSSNGNALTVGFDKVPMKTGYNLSSLDQLDINPVLGRPHARIGLVGQTALNSDGLPKFAGKPNAGARKVDEDLSESFRGPLIFHGWAKHLNTMSMRHIVDWMRMEHIQEVLKAEQHLITGIDGVRLNCYGDIAMCKRPVFEAFKIPDNCMQYKSPVEIPVGKKLGFPLHVVQIKGSTSLPWQGRHLDGDKTFTHRLNTSFMALSPGQWQIDVATVLIGREDNKLLHPAHVEALSLYCKLLSKAKDIKAATTGDKGRDLSPELDVQFQACSKRLLEKASKDDFQTFFASFMADEGQKYGKVPSPYEV